jgi:hypothetical protein
LFYIFCDGKNFAISGKSLEKRTSTHRRQQSKQSLARIVLHIMFI